MSQCFVSLALRQHLTDNRRSVSGMPIHVANSKQTCPPDTKTIKATPVFDLSSRKHANFHKSSGDLSMTVAGLFIASNQ
jgi:hypothetical protein